MLNEDLGTGLPIFNIEFLKIPYDFELCKDNSARF